MDCSPPGSSVHGILQARVLGRVAMPSSRGSSRHGEGRAVGALMATGGGGVHMKPAWGPHFVGSMQSHRQVGSSRLWELRLFGQKVSLWGFGGVGGWMGAGERD